MAGGAKDERQVRQRIGLIGRIVLRPAQIDGHPAHGFGRVMLAERGEDLAPNTVQRDLRIDVVRRRYTGAEDAMEDASSNLPCWQRASAR